MHVPFPSILKTLEARRGYGFAFSTFRARETALVLIDLTNMFFGRTDEDQRLALRLNTLAQTFRERGASVMWVRPAPFDHAAMMRDLLGQDLFELHEVAQQESDHRNQIATCLKPASDDLYVRKNLFSAFFPGSSPAEDTLRRRGIQNVIIGGVVTDVCVEASARDAFSCGFRTVILSDGCRGSTEEAHCSTLNKFQTFFGDVRSIDDVSNLVK